MWIRNDREFSQQHLMDSKTSIIPGVQIQEHIFADSELGRAEHNTASGTVLTTGLLEHYFALGYLSLEYFLHLHSDIGINAILLVIETGLNRKHPAADDGARFDDHLIVGLNDDCCCKRRLGTGEKADQKQQ